MAISHEERVKFIEGLDIPDALVAGAAASASESAAVAEGSSVSFVSNVQGQMKSDILNSTLLAQLAANKQHDRQNETVKWYKYYKEVLETVGWTVQNFDLSELSDANKHFSVDKLLLQLAAAYLSGGELTLFKTMIDSLKESANSSAVRLFDSSSKSFNKANFQVGVASNSGGNALFKIGVYTYSASQNIDHVIFFTFGSQKVTFYSGNQTMILNEDVYAQVRETVLKKLGRNAQDKIKGLDI